MKTTELLRHGTLGKATVLFTMLFSLQSVMADISINSSNFPDTNFRNYLTSKFGSSLSDNEIATCYALNVSNKSISSLTGIHYFDMLATLICNNNNLTQLDVSNNWNLQSLNCSYNKLTQLLVEGS